ncbi:MAG: thymidylate kinase [Planctomycetaceae bacterium]
MSFRVAFEGIDGSGKGTQAARLRDALAGDGRRVDLLSFPRYSETFFGRAAGEFLNGRFGPADAVDPFLVSLLFAGDRFESKAVIERADAANDVLIFDRYVASNIAHQAAKLPPDRRDELAAWVERIEYGIHKLPRPNLVILLDLPADEAQRRIARKRPRDYTDRAADLHEEDAAYLARVREVYHELASRGENWRVIDCLRDGEPRSAEEIGAEIAAIVRDGRER